MRLIPSRSSVYQRQAQLLYLWLRLWWLSFHPLFLPLIRHLNSFITANKILSTIYTSVEQRTASQIYYVTHLSAVLAGGASVSSSLLSITFTAYTYIYATTTTSIPSYMNRNTNFSRKALLAITTYITWSYIATGCCTLQLLLASYKQTIANNDIASQLHIQLATMYAYTQLPSYVIYTIY